jgi:hypothetical protein
MAYVNGHPSWGDISLNLETGHVFVQENWRYHWTVEPGATQWTLAQRRHFHNTLDRQIWSVWSNRIRIQVRGDHALVRRFPHGLPSLEFDIHWVLQGGHWTVNVRKMPPGSTPTTFISNVDFPHNTINLDSADLASYRPTNAAGDTRTFRAGPHEYGHTMPDPNDATQGNDDEYNGGANGADTDSIMNIGRQVRARHLTALLTELHRMVPQVAFSV